MLKLNKLLNPLHSTLLRRFSDLHKVVDFLDDVKNQPKRNMKIDIIKQFYIDNKKQKNLVD